MEEKERYELEFEDSGFKNYVLDNDNMENFYVSFTDLVILLNKQDNKIKLLEQENLSLQEQSIRDDQNWIEETEQLKKQLDSTDFYRQFCQLKSSSDDLIKGLTEQCEQLKQSQKQFAISELKKVKNYVDGRTYLAEYIRNRIKELKGE